MALKRASEFTLAELTRFWNEGYTGYFTPITFTDAMMENWLRCGDFDLGHSLVLLDGGELAGFSLAGVRERRAWIGGFGVAPASRGKGVAYGLFADHMAVLREELGLASVQLEVLVENWARKVYERAGMRVTRRLAILQGALPGASAWSGASASGAVGSERPGAATAAGSGVAQAAPAALLAHHARLHAGCPAVWQREPGWIAKSLPDTAAGLYTGPAEAPTGILLYAPAGEGLRVLDAAAETAATANELVAGLAHLHPGKSLVSVNEPEGGPVHAALIAAGLAEVRAQYELKWEA